METCRRWDIFELRIPGPSEGNPFTDESINGVFSSGSEEISVKGFYDGDGEYVVRFMPSSEGKYSYRITASFGEEHSGSLEVLPPAEGNHGPVRADGRRLVYADGTPYFSIGTTCYVWELQSDELIDETIKSLEESSFNKIRFCIFPKHYDYNLGEPRSYPYVGTPMDSSVLTRENFGEYTGKTAGNDWDLTRFNTAHFRHIEDCIRSLGRLGIEADLILMHPYDRWGFSSMPHEADLMYLSYAVARFSAFHNVWFSLANEYDLMRQKSASDWEIFGELVSKEDPYHHMLSVHNCITPYDFSKDFITHCSVQRTDLYMSSETATDYLDRYEKPVVFDEIAYEGDIQYGWGNITAEEMVRRFWEAAVRGAHPGHGETYLNNENILWWSHGGILRGESHKRFSLLKEVMAEVPGGALRQYRREWDEVCGVPSGDSRTPSFYLLYYSFMRPSFREFRFSEDEKWDVRVIDTWNMTVEDRGVFSGRFKVELPARQYMAIRLRKID